ncbi:MAG TPA: DinB family protein [Dehalococcoidia bacterium]|nr:DinB family protein [Dehalococcoidia bacterium]
MERLEIIEALKHLADVVEAELAGVPNDVLSARPSDDEWSLKQVVGHLRFADDIWYKRLYMVCTQTDPVLPTFAGEDAALEAARNATDLRPYIEGLRASRPRIVDLLSHAIDWTRIGNWRGEGRRSLKQLAEYLVSHDSDHIAQIRALKAPVAARQR